MENCVLAIVNICNNLSSYSYLFCVPNDLHSILMIIPERCTNTL